MHYEIFDLQMHYKVCSEIFYLTIVRININNGEKKKKKCFCRHLENISRNFKHGNNFKNKFCSLFAQFKVVF